MSETTGANAPLQDGYCITGMSNDPKEAPCKGCGQTRVIFQAHYFAFAGQQVLARCKACHEAAAQERRGEIFVKSVAGKLRDVWAKDRRLEEHPASAQSRTQRAAAIGDKGHANAAGHGLGDGETHCPPPPQRGDARRLAP